MGRAEADRGLEIGAHSHAEERKAALGGELLQQREMQRRLFVHRRNAHQPDDGKLQSVTAMRDEARDILRRDARLLRLLAGVHFDEQLACRAPDRACRSPP